MNKLPNSTLIGGTSDAQRIYADSKAHQVTHRGERYMRVPPYMIGNLDIFVPAALSYAQLMELLVESYVKMKELEKQ
jgi:hypothetical protein